MKIYSVVALTTESNGFFKAATYIRNEHGVMNYKELACSPYLGEVLSSFEDMFMLITNRKITSLVQDLIQNDCAFYKENGTYLFDSLSKNT